jgi:hypothetical protein
MPDPIIVEGVPPTKKLGVGRPKGSGSNIRLLKKLKPGNSIWELTWKKANSIRVSAQNAGIKIKIRKQPDSDRYAIWRME